MNNPPSDNEIIQSAIKLVQEGLRVTFPVKGYSMLPFIIGSKESVDLVKPENITTTHYGGVEILTPVDFNRRATVQITEEE